MELQEGDHDLRILGQVELRCRRCSRRNASHSPALLGLVTVSEDEDGLPYVKVEQLVRHSRERQLQWVASATDRGRPDLALELDKGRSMFATAIAPGPVRAAGEPDFPGEVRRVADCSGSIQLRCRHCHAMPRVGAPTLSQHALRVSDRRLVTTLYIDPGGRVWATT